MQLRLRTTAVLSLFVGLFAMALTAPQSAEAQGGEDYANGHINAHAYAFDGVDDGDGVDAGNIDVEYRNNYPARSVDFWFNANSIPSDTTAMLFEAGNGDAGYNLYFRDGDLYVGAWGGNLDPTFVSTSNAESGQWHHVALVFDGGNQELTGYLDGESFGSVDPGGGQLVNPSDNDQWAHSLARISGTGGANGGGTRLDDGSTPAGPAAGFNGTIDQFRIWSGVLSPQEVQGRKERIIDVPSHDADGNDQRPFLEPSGSVPVEDSIDIASRYETGGSFASFYVGAQSRGQIYGSGAPGWSACSGSCGDPQSVESTAPVGPVITDGDTATVGESGAEVTVTVGESDTVSVSSYGNKTGPLVQDGEQGEDFSNVDADRRLNVVWQVYPQAHYGDATREVPGDGTVDVDSVTIDFSEINGVNDSSQVKLLRRPHPGAAWENVTSDWTLDASNETFTSDVELSANFDESTAPSMLGQFAVGGTESVLPVELTSFKGISTGEGIQLTWQTASETNNAGFRVQRKADRGWSKVGSVDAKGGTTTEAQSYRFTDSDLPYSDKVTYRLKQVDLDGSSSFSEPITVERGAIDEVELRGTAPNPVRSRATVQFAVPEDRQTTDVRMQVYDVLGREVKSIDVMAGPGRHEQQLDASELSSGVYFLRLSAEDGAADTQRFTVVR